MTEVGAEQHVADKSQRSRLSLVVVLLAVMAGVVGWIRLGSGKNDPDIYWHLATGRWIAAHGAVPHVDVFSWIGIENSFRWVAQEWLFGLGAWWLYTLGSWNALYAALAILIALIVVLVYALTLQRSSWPLLAAAAAVIAILGLLVHMTPRPQLVTYALLLGVMLLLEREHPLPALALVVLGVNVHGGVWPLYVAIFAYYLLPSRPWLVLASAAAPLLTPNPAGVYPYPFPSLIEKSASFITEFAPTAPASRPQYLIVLILLLAAVWGQRFKLRDLLLGGALILLSLSAVRHMVFVYVLVVPILSPYITLQLLDRAHAGEAAGPQRRSAVIDGAIMLVLVLGIVLLTGKAVTGRVDPDRGYPAAASKWLQEHDAKRIFNLWDDGGYLIFNGTQPLVDGRGDPFDSRTNGGADIVKPYVAAIRLESDPLAFFEAYRMDYAVLPDKLGITRALKMSGDTEVVYANDGYTVFALPASDLK